MINLTLNGESVSTNQINLTEFLANRFEHAEKFAVAVNEIFIAKTNYAQVELKDGDQIELVMPMQGG